jgi:hypothetical protein
MTNMGGGAGIKRGGGGGTLIPTLTFTSAKPLLKRPVSVRSVTPTKNIMNIVLFIKYLVSRLSRLHFLSWVF